MYNNYFLKVLSYYIYKYIYFLFSDTNHKTKIMYNKIVKNYYYYLY